MSDTNTNTPVVAWPYPEDYVNHPIQQIGPYEFEALAAVMNSWVKDIE